MTQAEKEAILSLRQQQYSFSAIAETTGVPLGTIKSLLYADGMCQGEPERGAFVFYDCVCRGPDGSGRLRSLRHQPRGGGIVHAWDRVRIDDCREIEAMTALSGDHPKYIGWVPVERVLKQKEYD